MTIVSLEPFLTDLVLHYDRGELLVGVTETCAKLHPEHSPVTVVTEGPSRGSGELADLLSTARVQLDQLRALQPEVVLTSLRKSEEGRVAGLQEELRAVIGNSVRLVSCSNARLEELYKSYEKVAQLVGAAGRGSLLAQRAKAEAMNWIDNFYGRLKLRQVTVLVDVEPLRLGGLWIPDMIQMASGRSQALPGEAHREVSWEEVQKFRPDVLLIAPNLPLEEALPTFFKFQELPDWEELPAVRRGLVFFTSGQEYILRPSQKIREAMAILVSAMAGFDSGYISPRDSFRRLRWLELHRHRFMKPDDGRSS